VLQDGTFEADSQLPEPRLQPPCAVLAAQARLGRPHATNTGRGSTDCLMATPTRKRNRYFGLGDAVGSAVVEPSRSRANSCSAHSCPPSRRCVVCGECPSRPSLSSTAGESRNLTSLQGNRLGSRVIPENHRLPRSLPFRQFQVLLTLFSKSFSISPHGTFSLSVSHRYLALDGVHHPLRTVLPNSPTRRSKAAGDPPTATPRGSHPLWRTLPGVLDSAAESQQCSRSYNSGRCETYQIRLGLIPVHSPLLGEFRLVSFPAPINMLKFSPSDPIRSLPTTGMHGIEHRVSERRALWPLGSPSGVFSTTWIAASWPAAASLLNGTGCS